MVPNWSRPAVKGGFKQELCEESFLFYDAIQSNRRRIRRKEGPRKIQKKAERTMAAAPMGSHWGEKLWTVIFGENEFVSQTFSFEYIALPPTIFIMNGRTVMVMIIIILNSSPPNGPFLLINIHIW